MWAAGNGHLDCVTALLATEEGRESMALKGEGGATALTVAGRRRQLEAAVLLLRHGCVNV
jgi:ankyrin repeat protein